MSLEKKQVVPPTRFIESITIAKGIGIALVVIGHYFPSDSPQYWKSIHHIFYKFHMPLFFIVSGYLYAVITSKRGFTISLVKRKFNRLIVPFCVIAAVAFVIKYLVGFFFALEHPVRPNSLFMIFITPKGSFFPLLWFVYSLFIIHMLFPTIKTIFKMKYRVFLICVVLSLFDWPRCFYLKNVFEYLPYFCFGALFLEKYDFDKLNMKTLSTFLFVGSFFFTVAYLLNDLVRYTSIGGELLRIAMGVSGGMATISVAAMYRRRFKNNKIIYSMGLHSMSIYLLHPFFSAGIYILNYQLFKSRSFFLPAAIAIFSGILIPLMMEKYIIRKNRLMRRYMLGLP